MIKRLKNVEQIFANMVTYRIFMKFGHGYSSDNSGDGPVKDSSSDTESSSSSQSDCYARRKRSALEILFLEELLQSNNKKSRRGNIERDRKHPLEFIHSWDDTMFKRQFRLTREDFFDLLSLNKN